jgi:hypothetical protein
MEKKKGEAATKIKEAYRLWEGQEQEEEKEEEMIVCFLYVLSFYEFFYW